MCSSPTWTRSISRYALSSTAQQASTRQVTTTNPDEGDLHPLRDEDGHVLEHVESDEEAVLEAPPEVANLRRREEDVPSTSRCNDDLLPTANDPVQLHNRRQHYDEDLEQQVESENDASAIVLFCSLHRPRTCQRRCTASLYSTTPTIQRWRVASIA